MAAPQRCVPTWQAEKRKEKVEVSAAAGSWPDAWRVDIGSVIDGSTAARRASGGSAPHFPQAFASPATTLSAAAIKIAATPTRSEQMRQRPGGCPGTHLQPDRTGEPGDQAHRQGSI